MGKRAWWSFLVYLLFAVAAVDAGADDLVKDLRRDVQESINILVGASARLQADSAPIAEIAKLKTSAENIRAAHLLMEERFRSSSEKATTLGGKANERQNSVAEGYRKALEAYLALIDVLPADGTASAATLESLKTLLESIAPKRKRALLGTLPYKHLGYPAREPATSPTVVPAYKGGNRTVNPADTAATSEVSLSKEIVELAQSLQWNPVLIYEWVKNNVETEWYFGVMKGAEETLRQKSGNDADQAALLVSLLRASGFPARFVKGTIEFFPGIDKVKNLTGIDDPMKIAAFFQKSGIPFKAVIAGGKIANFQVEHIWVETFIPYSNYRGAVIDDMGKSWLGLDTSIKPPGLAWNVPLEIPGFPLVALRDDYLQAVQTVTPLEFVRAKAEEYLALTNPGKSWQDLLQTKTIIPDILNIIPASLQFKQIAITGEYTELPAELKHKLTVSATDNSSELFSITLETHKLSNRKLALKAEPETVEDQTIIDSFGGLDNTPSYLVRLRPVLTLDGERLVVAQDGLPMGADFTLNIDIATPNGTERISSSQVNGNLAVIGVVGQKALTPAAITESDDAEAILHKEAIGYIDRWNRAEDDLAALMGQRISRPAVSIATVGGQIDVTFLMDTPHDFQWKGLFLDAGYRRIETIGRNGLEKEFMRLSALQGSVLEHRIFEDDLKVDSISTAKLLQLAKGGGTQIISIDKTNIDALLPTLPFDVAVKQDIANAVNQGLSITIPQTEIGYQDWLGIGYLKENKDTGEAGWMLSGGIAGGMTVWNVERWDSAVIQAIADALRAPYGGTPNTDPSSAASIVKIPDTDEQFGIVGKPVGKMLQAKVLDKRQKPVKGASVTFSVRAGGGTLGSSNDTSVTVNTNRTGIASISLTLGKKTADNPFFLFTAGNTYFDQYGGNVVDVTASTGITITSPFAAYGKPDRPVKIEKLLGDGNRALPNNPAGSLLARVIDQYENPISNIPVSFMALPPVSRNPSAPFPASPRPVTFYLPAECSEAYPLYGSCPSKLALVVTSNYMGAVVNAMMGDTVETDHTIQVTSTGLPAVYYSLSGDGFRGSYGDYIPPGLFIRSLQIVNDKGQVIAAAKVGTPLAKPLVSELFLLYDDFTITPTGNLVLSGIVKTKPIKDGSVAYKSSGGSVSGTVNLNNGKYQTTYTAGMIPAFNTIEALGVADISVPMVLYTNYMNSGTYTLPSFVRGTEPLREYPGKLALTSYNPTQYTCSPTGCKLREKVMTFQTGQQAIFFTMDDPNYHYLIGQPSPATHAVYGVSIVQNTGKVFLNKWGYSLNDLKFNYTISPPEYQASIADVELYKGNDIVMYIAGETKGAGSATLARGAKFDIASQYLSQVVLNYGSDVEVRSEKKAVTVDRIDLIEVLDTNNPCNKAPWGINGNKFAVAKNQSGEAILRVVARGMRPSNSGSILWTLFNSNSTGNISNEINAPGDISVDDDILMVAIDNNENGIFDDSDPVIATFKIGVVSPTSYENSGSALQAAAIGGGGLDYNLASSFLFKFIGLSNNSPIQPTNINNLSSVILTDEEIVDSISHRAGSTFVPQDAYYDSCTTTVTNYIYDNNEAATILVNSQAIKNWYSTRLKSRYENGDLIEGSGNRITYPNPENGIALNVDGDAYTDTHFGIGRAKVSYLDGDANVIKKDGKMCVETLLIKAGISDIYDYNYYAKGDVGELLSQRAAMLQLGWNSDLNNGTTAGKLFYNTFIIDKTINLYSEYFDDTFGITRIYYLCF